MEFMENDVSKVKDTGLFHRSGFITRFPARRNEPVMLADDPWRKGMGSDPSILVLFSSQNPAPPVVP